MSVKIYEDRDMSKDWREKLEISNVVQLNNLWDIATHNTPYDKKVQALQYFADGLKIEHDICNPICLTDG